MSDEFQRIEVITGTARRRRWTVAEKLRIVEESRVRLVFKTFTPSGVRRSVLD